MKAQIDLRDVSKTHEPITLTLDRKTKARLLKNVAKGSISKFVDIAINQLLDSYETKRS